MTLPLFERVRGDSPLIVNVPHAGTHLPAELHARLTPAARAVPDTDWHVEKLYAFAPAAGVTLMHATHSRFVVDLNRDPAGVALYAGADNSELCPTGTFDSAPIYVGTPPDAAEIEARTRTFFAPYHETLRGEIERVRARHGYAILLDGHSIRAEVPRFFAGRLPDLNLGTADGRSCAPALEQAAASVLASAAPLTHIVNGRFKGGWITRHYGQPAASVHALQLEMAQAAYMDEAPPYAWDARKASAVEAVLRRLVDTLLAWRPAP